MFMTVQLKDVVFRCQNVKNAEVDWSVRLSFLDIAGFGSQSFKLWLSQTNDLIFENCPFLARCSALLRSGQGLVALVAGFCD